MNDSLIATIANLIACVCAGPVWAFTLIYGVKVRWYRSLLGTSLFSLFLSFSLLFGMIISRRIAGFEWDWYQELAVGVYSFMFLSFSFFFAIFLVERRRGKDTLSVPIGKVITGEIMLPKSTKE